MKSSHAAVLVIGLCIAGCDRRDSSSFANTPDPLVLATWDDGSIELSRWLRTSGFVSVQTIEIPTEFAATEFRRIQCSVDCGEVVVLLKTGDLWRLLADNGRATLINGVTTSFAADFSRRRIVAAGFAPRSARIDAVISLAELGQDGDVEFEKMLKILDFDIVYHLDVDWTNGVGLALAAPREFVLFSVPELEVLARGKTDVADEGFLELHALQGHQAFLVITDGGDPLILSAKNEGDIYEVSCILLGGKCTNGTVSGDGKVWLYESEANVIRYYDLKGKLLRKRDYGSTGRALSCFAVTGDTAIGVSDDGTLWEKEIPRID